jgi:hypothetical protein
MRTDETRMVGWLALRADNPRSARLATFLRLFRFCDRHRGRYAEFFPQPVDKRLRALLGMQQHQAITARAGIGFAPAVRVNLNTRWWNRFQIILCVHRLNALPFETNTSKVK